MGRRAGIWITIAIVHLSFSFTFSQNENRSLRTGKLLMEEGFYFRALDKFNPPLALDSSATEINLLASYCYLELQFPEKALKLLNKIENSDCKHLLQAYAFYEQEHFQKAKETLKRTPGTDCHLSIDHEKLRHLIDQATLAYQNTKGYVASNFGPTINTNDREYSAVMINNFDSVLFTSRRKDSKAEIARDGMAYESIFITGVDRTDQWSPPTHFRSSIESKSSHDATVQIYEQGKMVIIFHDGDLYTAKKEGNRWVNQKILEPVNTLYNETHCFITEDQQTIYFASDFETVFGDLDLFITKKKADGKWTKPQAIKELNTPFDEDAPFLSDNGTFYFSSRGHNSIGGFDIFSTSCNEITGQWGEIKNLGHPINSVADDIYYTTYGKLAYLSSSRIGGYGLLDLYRVFLFNKIKMQGKLVDQATREPIPGATIDFEYGPWFLRGYSDYDGNYEMHVPIDKTMQVTIQKDSIDIHRGNYKVRVFLGNKNMDNFDFVIDLDPFQDIEPEITTDLFSFSDTVMINLQVRNDLQKNDMINSVPDKMEQQWVDSLNAHYANRFEYEEAEISKVITVQFGFDETKLPSASVDQLESLLKTIENDHFDYLEITGHTDQQGSEKYNTKLSLFRAASVREYLSKRGIPENKMITRGSGENELLITGESESDLAQNRRVEIKIIR